MVLQGIAHGYVELNSLDDVAALLAWLTAIAPTLAAPTPLPELTVTTSGK